VKHLTADWLFSLKLFDFSTSETHYLNTVHKFMHVFTVLLRIVVCWHVELIMGV